MVKDIVNIEASDVRGKTVERHVVECRVVLLMPQVHVAQLKVACRAVVEQVQSYLRTVHAQVKPTLMTVHRQVFQRERIAQEHPSPSGIRTQAHLRVRREGNRLPVVARRAECIVIVVARTLKHRRIDIMLRFYVALVHLVEPADDAANQSQFPGRTLHHGVCLHGIQHHRDRLLRTGRSRHHHHQS